MNKEDLVAKINSVVDSRLVYNYSVLDSGKLSESVVSDMIERQEEVFLHVELHNLKVGLNEGSTLITPEVIAQVEGLCNKVEAMKRAEEQTKTGLGKN